MSKQDIPKAEVLEQNIADLPGQFVLVPDAGYEVCSWRPGPPGSGPPTQVHLLIPTPVEGATMVIRFKSARALDEFVGILLEYRKEVWGGGRGS
jgi:hypothetical protein